jgi:UDP-galactopyranose mutase
MRSDYIIVGSGLTGAVIARQLADAGRSVLIAERRAHCGGNVHDHLHSSGVRVHTYGPHYFRTNSETLWRYVTRFAEFDRYEACVKSFVDSRYENWPLTASQICRSAGENWTPAFRGRPRNFEDAALAKMPRAVYEKFVRGYTEKQWGVAPRLLAADLARRIEIRVDDDSRFSQHRYQGIPRQGYAALMQNLLSGIPLVLDCDYLRHRRAFEHRRMLIFTGPIDEYFGFDLGRLHYRGQRREHRFEPEADRIQPCGQVNFPDTANGPQIRQLEWKHMLPRETVAHIRGTVLTREIPVSPADPEAYEYPFPDRRNARLYARYRRRVGAIPDLLICGRLGEYKYYDMDQSIARALMLAEQIVQNGRRRAA